MILIQICRRSISTQKTQHNYAVRGRFLDIVVVNLIYYKKSDTDTVENSACPPEGLCGTEPKGVQLFLLSILLV